MISINKNSMRVITKSLLLIALVLLLADHWVTVETVSTPPAAAAADVLSLPIAFEANQGQVDKNVRFLARSHGHHMFLTPSEAILTLMPRAAASMQPTVVRLTFVGKNDQPELEGVDRLPGVVNYYLGQDRSGWQAGIPTYAKVRYTDLYPGIDALFYGNQSELEYDFIVAPGANPEAILMRVGGSVPDNFNLRISASGNLVIDTVSGQVELRKPLIYQDKNGRRHKVAAEYRLVGADSFGFTVAAYNPDLPLVIDPVIDFSTYFGGSGDDYGYSIATDTAGNIYLTGATNSADFPGTAGGYSGTGSRCPSDLPMRECYDAFVTKINASGTAVLYSTYIGNPGEDKGHAIAVDGAGNAYITGMVSLAGDPPNDDLFIYEYALVVKLGPGGDMVYGFAWGEGAGLVGHGIAVDNQGQAYVAGEVTSTILTTPNAVQPEKGEMTDGFISVISSDGSSLVYSTYLGGNNTYCDVCASKVTAIAVDRDGMIYATGQAAPSYPVTDNAYRKTFDGLWEAFVAKIDPGKPGPAGLVYSSFLGGLDTDIGQDIVVDATGMVFVTGSTQSYDFPSSAGAFDRTCGTDGICNPTTVCDPGIPPKCYTDPKSDVFIVKMDLTKSGSSSLVYSTFVGGGGQEVGLGIAVDRNGRAYVTGSTWSPDFPVVNPIKAEYSGKLDIFAFTLNPDASQMVFSTYIGGGSDDEAYAITLDTNGRAYLTGNTGSGAFPVTNPLLGRSSGWEAFVTRITFDTQAENNRVYLPMIKH